MDIRLGVAFRDAQELVDGVPLILREQNRRLGKILEVDPLYQRETTFIINRECSGERRTGRSELLIAFFEHLAKTLSGSPVSGFFKLIGEKCGIVANFVYVKTKSPVDDTKKLAHETFTLIHETIIAVCETAVKGDARGLTAGAHF